MTNIKKYRSIFQRLQIFFILILCLPTFSCGNKYKKLNKIESLFIQMIEDDSIYPECNSKNNIPKYKDLSKDELIVFLEVQFLEVTKIPKFTIVKDPNQNPRRDNADSLILRYTITDNQNNPKKSVCHKMVADYLYAQKLLTKITDRQNVGENYQNLPNKRIVYFKINKNEKIRFDSVEYTSNNTSNRFRFKQALYLPTFNQGKVKYIGNTFFEFKASLEDKKWHKSMTLIPLIKSDDFINMSIDFFDIPSTQLLYDHKGNIISNTFQKSSDLKE